MSGTTDGAWFDRVCVSTYLGDRINHPDPAPTWCWTEEEDTDDDDTL